MKRVRTYETVTVRTACSKDTTVPSQILRKIYITLYHLCSGKHAHGDHCVHFVLCAFRMPGKLFCFPFMDAG